MAKLKSAVGMPDKVEIAPKVVLARDVAERLMVQAWREGSPTLAAWVQAVLVRRRQREAEGRRRTGG